jgi:hypothetical protein
MQSPEIPAGEACAAIWVSRHHAQPDCVFRMRCTARSSVVCMTASLDLSDCHLRPPAHGHFVRGCRVTMSDSPVSCTMSVVVTNLARFFKPKCDRVARFPSLPDELRERELPSLVMSHLELGRWRGRGSDRAQPVVRAANAVHPSKCGGGVWPVDSPMVPVHEIAFPPNRPDSLTAPSGATS